MRGRHFGIFGLVVLAAPAAMARDPEPSPAPLAVPASHREGFYWRAAGPLTAGAVADLAVHVAEDGRTQIAVVDRDGGVWLSRDSGASWSRVLAPPGGGLGARSRDEELLLGIEARIDEVIDDRQLSIGEDDEDATEEAIEEAREQAAAAAAAAAEEAVDAVEADLGVDPLLTVAQPVRAPPRAWFTAEGLLLVGRADGLHGSWDAVRWERELDVQATALVRTPEGWLLGTTDGVRLSADPDDWSGAEAALEGVVVHDLAVDRDALLAATDQGLWHSRDARRWLGEGVLDEPVFAVLADPDSDRVWLALEQAVRVADEGGRALRAPSATAPASVGTLLRIAPDHVLAAGRSGVWESTDGGETWWPLLRGLATVEAHTLGVADGTLWVAAETGLYRLVEGEPPLADVSAPDWIDIGILLDAALGRSGLASERIGSRFVAAAMPRAEIAFTWLPQASLDYDAGSGTRHTSGGDWQVVATIVWLPRTISSDPSLYVINDDQLLDVSGAQEGGTLDRQAAVASAEVARDVSQLYHSRQALAAERPVVAARPLVDQVVHELRIEEIEARLDALTEGAVSRWEATP